MCQSIHTCGRRQSLRHAGHHFRIDYRYDRDIMRIYTYELSLLFFISNNVVDRRLCRRSRSRSHRDHRYSLVLRRCNTFQRNHIAELRVVNDDTDSLTGILWRSATDGNQIISSSLLKSLYPFFHNFYRRICLYFIIDRICIARSVQKICHFLYHLELYEILVCNDQSLLKTSSLHFRQDFLDRTCTMITCFIEHKSVYHRLYLLSVSFPVIHCFIFI